MKEDFLEDIKKAISSTTRAIAEDKEIEVVFEDNLTSTDNKIVLPKIDNNEDFYIVKSVDSQEICDKIRKADLDFTS